MFVCYKALSYLFRIIMFCACICPSQYMFFIGLAATIMLLTYATYDLICSAWRLYNAVYFCLALANIIVEMIYMYYAAIYMF